MGDGVDDGVVRAIQAGDDAAFTAAVARHRGELQLHCYRLLGSFTDAEDHVQETFLRAWRRRSTYAGRASVRAWLYGIATHACLDTLRRDPARRVVLTGSGTGPADPAEIPWLEPYPDELLDAVAVSADLPDAALVAKETVQLAFLAAIQVLSPNQRAVLVLRDVLGWSAAETAGLLDTSLASVTSALQRGRAALRRQLPERAEDWQPEDPSAAERTLLARYMEAHARADADAVVALLSEDVCFTMPPQPLRYAGREALAAFFGETFGPSALGEFHLVPTRANRQPAAANYLRRRGDTRFRALSLDVLRIERGRLAEITTFEPHLFAAFGLPEEIVPPTR